MTRRERNYLIVGGLIGTVATLAGVYAQQHGAFGSLGLVYSGGTVIDPTMRPHLRDRMLPLRMGVRRLGI